MHSSASYLTGHFRAITLGVTGVIPRVHAAERLNDETPPEGGATSMRIVEAFDTQVRFA